MPKVIITGYCDKGCAAGNNAEDACEKEHCNQDDQLFRTHADIITTVNRLESGTGKGLT